MSDAEVNPFTYHQDCHQSSLLPCHAKLAITYQYVRVYGKGTCNILKTVCKLARALLSHPQWRGDNPPKHTKRMTNQKLSGATDGESWAHSPRYPRTRHHTWQQDPPQSWKSTLLKGVDIKDSDCNLRQPLWFLSTCLQLIPMITTLPYRKESRKNRVTDENFGSFNTSRDRE